MTITTTIQVSGMTCSSCTNSITNCINKLDDVDSVSVSLLTEEAIIKHNPQITSDYLLEKIDDLGFDGSLISSTDDSSYNSNLTNEKFEKLSNNLSKFKTIFQISGMTCSSCTNSITNELLKLEGVSSVDVSLITEEATIIHNNSISTDDILNTIDDLGFDGNLISSLELRDNDKINDISYKAEITIGGMTCSACVNSITNALKELNGVEEVNVSLLTERATVLFNKQITVEEILETVEDVGFDASLIKVDEVTSAVVSTANTTTDINDIDLKIHGSLAPTWSISIENVIIPLPGIISCTVLIASEIVHIKYDSNIIGVRIIIEKINELNYDAILVNKLDTSSQVDLLSKIKEIRYWKNNVFSLLKFGFPLMFIAHILPILRKYFKWNLNSFKIYRGIYIDIMIQLILSTYIQFSLGKKYYINTYKSLKHKAGSMDVLICFSTTIIYFYSLISVFHGLIADTYPNVLFDTSTMLFLFVGIGKWVESKAKGNTSSALSKLLSLTPSSCIIVEDSNIFNNEKNSIYSLDSSTIQQREISIDLLQKGDIAIILPGSKIPADGVCIFGSSEIDESLLTGESLPVIKDVGSPLIAGSVNITSTIYMKVTTLGEKTQLQQIVKLVKDAQISTAPIQRISDSIASVFVILILTLSLITLIFWTMYVYCSPIDDVPKFFLKENEENSTLEIQYFKILQIAISVIVVACPCALGLAAPTGVMVGTGVGATNGILIKGGEILENANKIDTIIFDKTGTLTKGVMELTNHKFLSKNDNRMIWSLVHAIESNSEHPISKALVKGSLNELVNNELIPFEFSYVNTHAGLGISTNCINLETNEKLDVKLGNSKFLKSFDVINMNELDESINENTKSLKISSFCYILINNRFIGFIELSDTLKDDSKKTIETFIQSGYSVGMVTGDSIQTSKYVAGLLGIPLNNVLAESSPEMKLEYIKGLQNKGLKVAFIGDGINDAPALVQSDIGMAISSGTDIAMSAADIVLLSSTMESNNDSHIGLLGSFAALDISRSTFHTIRLNFMLAIIYNLIMLPIAMGILIIPFNRTLNPMFASAAMACSSTSVVVNSLRLKRWNIDDLKKNNEKLLKFNFDEVNLGWNDGNADLRNEINEFDLDSFIINNKTKKGFLTRFWRIFNRQSAYSRLNDDE